MIWAAGDTVLALWTEKGRLHTAGIVNRGEVANEHEHSLWLSARHIASAPTGHIMLVGDEALSAWMFDARGLHATSTVKITSALAWASSAVFDGTRFLIAWSEEGDEMKLASLAPGGDRVSAPITIGPGLDPLQRIVMASSGGITWIAWAEEGRALGIRVTRSGAIDPAPVVLLQDPRIPAARARSIASSDGRFLLAVEGGSRDLLLVPFDGQLNIGTTVELPDTTIGTLVGEPSGFAFLRGSAKPSELWTPRTFAVVRLALDGTYLRERAYTAMGAGLASDGTGLLLALGVNSRIGDRGESVLSLEAVAGGGQIEIARAGLQLETESKCTVDPVDGYR
jgi:hypothetical protein